MDPAITAALAAAPAAAGAPLTGARVLADNPRDDPAGAAVDSSPSIDPTPAQAKTDLGGQCTKGLEDTSADGCVSGDTRSSTDVVLVGDSHAAQWVGPLAVVAKQRGWRLTSYTKAICPFSTQDVATGSGGGVIRPYPQCDSWRDAVRAKLVAAPPRLLVVSSVDVQAVVGGSVVGQDESRQLVATGLQQMWQSFLDVGTKVAVMADTPWPSFDLPGCVAQHPDALTQCTFDRDQANHATGTALAAATAATPGVTGIDLGDAVCPTQRCAPVIGGVLLYRDLNHMSNTYATTLAPRLDKLLPAIS